MKYENLHIGICVPYHGPWQPQFGMSLATMMSYSAQSPLARCKSQRLTLLTSGGSMLPQTRQTLLTRAIEYECTHMLWLDSDMRFPRDTLRRLLAHSVGFVAAQGVTKNIPAEPTAKDLDGRPVFSDAEAEGKVRIGYIGLAVALIQTKIIKNTREPHFEMPWDPNIRAYGGEDGYFCRKYREETGLDIWLDHDLSKKIGHVGSFTYDYRVLGTVQRVATDGVHSRSGTKPKLQSAS